MRIGQLRHRVELQRPVDNQDGYGEVKRTYTTDTTVWASIEPLQGREFEYAQQISAETTLKITIRYNSNVTPKYRLKFGTRIFEITSLINPKERNEYLVLMCKEVD